MVPGYEDITPLTVLFEQTVRSDHRLSNQNPHIDLLSVQLRLQNHVEEFPPFPVDQFRFIFRLSARPLHHALGDLGKLSHKDSSNSFHGDYLWYCPRIHHSKEHIMPTYVRATIPWVNFRC